MFKFYNHYIFPRLADLSLRSKNISRERARLVPRAWGRVLEIGFGSGLNLPFYSKKVSHLIALEPSKEFFQLAKNRLKKLNFPFQFILASAEKIPLKTNSVDCVVMTWALCSIERPSRALKEIKRVLKPNGRFFFIEHGRSSRPIYKYLQNLFNPVWKQFSHGCHLNREPDQLIVRAGFQILKMEITSSRTILNQQYWGWAKNSDVKQPPKAR